MQIFLWRIWGSESGPFTVSLEKTISSDKTSKDQRFVADNREERMCVGNMLSFVELKKVKEFNVASDGKFKTDAVPYVRMNL